MKFFCCSEKTHFDPDLPWKEKPMKVNSVIDVHVSICKKLVNHLSLKVLLFCSLHQTYTMNETNNVTRAITCFFLSLAWEVASLAFRDTSVGFSSEERAH